MRTLTIVPGVLLLAVCLSACGGSTAPTTPPPPAEAPTSAATAVAALGDRKAPFESTTALTVIDAAEAAGIPVVGEAKADRSLCARYAGCQSAATVGNVRVIVFESAQAAQAYGSSPDGAEIEKAGGRRYWSLVEYSALGSDERSAWRDLQRGIIA